MGSAVQIGLLEQRLLHSVSSTPAPLGLLNPVVSVNPSSYIAAPSPFVVGSAAAGVGVNYKLNLNPAGMTNISTWAVDWGDGTYGTINNATSFNHIFVTPSGAADIITATATNSAGTIYTSTSAVTVEPAPVISSFQVNDGSASRSVVTSLSITFNEPVQSAARAFSLTQTARAGALLPTAYQYQLSSSNGQRTYTLSFAQNAFPVDAGSSLPSGTYSLSIDPSKVIATDGIAMEAGRQFAFYRLAGDITGSGASTVSNPDVGSPIPVSYQPAVALNAVAPASVGSPLTLTATAATFGNNGDHTTYHWIVLHNGAEVMLPGSYGSGAASTAGQFQLSPAGSVLTATPSLTFIPSDAGVWTAQVIVSDVDLGLSSSTNATPFNVANSAVPDSLVTTIAPATGGLDTISYNGVTLLDGGTGGFYTGISAFASDGTSPGSFLHGYNLLNDSYTTSSGSLSGSVNYVHLPNELDFNFTVTNNAPVFSGLVFNGFSFTLAYDLQNLSGEDFRSLSVGGNSASANIVSNGSAVGTATLGVQEQTPGHIGFYQSPSGNLYSARFDTTADASQGQAPVILQPGQSATYHAFLRFSTTPGANLTVDAQQALSAHGVLPIGFSTASSALPAVNWSDRRPITMLYPLTAAFQNPNSDPHLASDLLTFASTQIDIMLADGSQGAVSWDISDPANVSAYDGAPELATTLIPQLSQSLVNYVVPSAQIGKHYVPQANGSLIGEYFAMFRNAGLETGLSLRMTQAFPQQQIDNVWQGNSLDPAALLIGRIEYAKQNWGCTLFYIDSTIAGAQETAVLAAVHAAEPGVLLIPEHHSDADFANSAGYYEEPVAESITRTPGVNDVTSPAVRVAFPTGFIVTRADLSDPAFTSADIATMAESMAQGNVFFIQGTNTAASAQRMLAFNNSSGQTDYSNSTITVRMVTAPDGTAADQFLRNGNVIYSQQMSAVQLPQGANSFAVVNVGPASPVTFSFAGSNNTLVIDTLGGNPFANGYVFNPDPSLNNSLILI